MGKAQGWQRLLGEVFSVDQQLPGENLVHMWLEHRQAKREAVMMWALADELGLGAAQLKALSGTEAYGVYDWEASRPERHSFYPSLAVIRHVCDELFRLRDEQAAR